MMHLTDKLRAQIERVFGTGCPYCGKRITNLFAEWTDDIYGVCLGTTAIDCPYCQEFIVHKYPNPLHRKQPLVKATTEPRVWRKRTGVAAFLRLTECESLAQAMEQHDMPGAFEGYLWADDSNVPPAPLPDK